MNEVLDIRNKIYEVRGLKVMLDRDLAQMYDVETKALNRAVKRNIERFPEDFMFQLTDDECKEILKYQIGTSSWGGLRRPPFAFTEQGVAMLSSVLKSERAIKVNIGIMRAFVAVRQSLPSIATTQDIEDLKTRVRTLEAIASGTLEQMGGIRAEVDAIYEVLNQLQNKPAEPLTPIGYQATLDREKEDK